MARSGKTGDGSLWNGTVVSADDFQDAMEDHHDDGEEQSAGPGVDGQAKRRGQAFPTTNEQVNHEEAEETKNQGVDMELAQESCSAIIVEFREFPEEYSTGQTHDQAHKRDFKNALQGEFLLVVLEAHNNQKQICDGFRNHESSDDGDKPGKQHNRQIEQEAEEDQRCHVLQSLCTAFSPCPENQRDSKDGEGDVAQDGKGVVPFSQSPAVLGQQGEEDAQHDHAVNQEVFRPSAFSGQMLIVEIEQQIEDGHRNGSDKLTPGQCGCVSFKAAAA
ncbi:hypothetical protein DSECCO2_291560 [anaerobic digester metagenome]